MNRQQRRALHKQEKQLPKEPVYQLRRSDIEKIKADAREEAVQMAMILLFSIPIKVMHDSYGWGPKRLPEFADKLTNEYGKFERSEMSLEEYNQFVYEQTGMKFEKTK